MVKAARARRRPIPCERCGQDAFARGKYRTRARALTRYFQCRACRHTFSKTDGESDPLAGVEPVRAWDLASLYAAAPAGVPWTWPGYLARGALTLLAGEPKSGKSTLSFGLLPALLQGGEFLGSEVEPLPVLYFTEEPVATVREKCEAFKLAAGLPLRIVFKHDCAGGWARTLAAASDQLQERPALLVLDTLAAFGVPENNVYAIEGACSALKELAARFDVPVLALHHTRKVSGGGLERIRGHSALAGAVDLAVLLDVDGDGNRTLEVQGRFRETPERFAFRLEGERFERASADAQDS